MIGHGLSAHRAFALVLVAFMVLGSAYSITTPLFEAPDEQWHFAFVQSVAQGHGLPVQKPGQTDHLARQEASQPPLYYLIAAGATFWIDTADFPGIVWENPHYGFGVPGVVNDNKNLFIHTAQESFPWHNTALAVHLARFISICFGALAVLFTYLLSLEFFRGEKTLAAASAAFLAFVPQFLFVSGAVSNDSAIVAMAAFALWMMVRMANAEVRPQADDREDSFTPSFPPSVIMGVAAGLAALAKVSGLGISVLGAAVIVSVYRRNIRALWINLLCFAFSVSLVAGWWYARNILLYGEFTGTEMMLSIFGERVTALSFAQFSAQLSEVWETFWVGFGWGNVRAPSGGYAAFGLLMAISALGWIRFTICDLRFVNAKNGDLNSKYQASNILIAIFWIALTFGAFLRWMLLTQAPHGRLLFPALPALAPLVIFGWTRLQGCNALSAVQVSAKQPLSRAVAALIPGGALGAAALIALFTILRPAYAIPPAISEGDLARIAQRVDISYDDKIKLLGYDVLPPRGLPDGSITLTLYWQALKQMGDDYSIGIALLDANRQVLSQRSSYPGHGTLPTRLWRAGQTIQDTYWVPIPATVSAPSVAQIQISLFKRETQKDLPAVDPQGNMITPMIGRFKIGSPQPVEALPQNRTGDVFGDQIRLIGYDVNRDEIAFYWKRVTPMNADYTVFIHWLDAGEKIIAQKDAEPNVPTSWWDDGEVIVDRFVRRANRVRVGWYRADTGERLRVGNDDHVILGMGP